MLFGQVVIGPPGSGKTTYTNGIYHFYETIGRKVAIVNLDPANEYLPYEPQIDIQNLLSLKKVMNEQKLGPNGGLVYCLEYLDGNFEWLINKLKEVEDCYIVFDFPGQVELFTLHTCLKSIVSKLEKKGYRLCCVNLIDSNYCTDDTKFVAAVLISLQSMLHLELPHINVLSKIDLLLHYDKKLPRRLDFYTQVQDPTKLLEFFDDQTVHKKYIKLNQALCQLIEEYSLVGFYPLSIENKDTVLRLAKAIDKCNGCVFGGLERGNEHIMNSVLRLNDYYSNDELFYSNDVINESFSDNE